MSGINGTSLLPVRVPRGLRPETTYRFYANIGAKNAVIKRGFWVEAQVLWDDGDKQHGDLLKTLLVHFSENGDAMCGAWMKEQFLTTDNVADVTCLRCLIQLKKKVDPQ